MSHVSGIARAAAALVLGLAIGAPALASRADDLFDFDGASGYAPWAGVVANEKGVLFGSTTIGGSGPCFGGAGCGTLYSLTPPTDGSGQWQLEVIYDFQGGRDGEGPHAPLTLGPHGELFGYTTGGTVAGDDGSVYGIAACEHGSGLVFRLVPPTGGIGAWTRSVIAKVATRAYGPDWLGAGTRGSLVGTVFGDFDFYPGAAFRLLPPAEGEDTWTVDWLWSFGRGPDRNPVNLVTGPGGHLFGVLSGGDSTNGSVFELHLN